MSVIYVWKKLNKSKRLKKKFKSVQTTTWHPKLSLLTLLTPHSTSLLYVFFTIANIILYTDSEINESHEYFIFEQRTLSSITLIKSFFSAKILSSKEPNLQIRSELLKFPN